jgi:hypothetical protein
MKEDRWSMPQLTKGGKWVFGWLVVGPRSEIKIPIEAQCEYGLRDRSRVLFVRGSRRSGGFSIARASRLPPLLVKRAIGKGQLGRDGQILVPPSLGIQPGDRLALVRGSGYALGLAARGPIHELALQHPELELR